MVIASGNTLRDGPLALRSRRRRRLAGASPALGKPLGFHAPYPEEAAPRRPSRRIEADDRPFFTSLLEQDRFRLRVAKALSLPRWAFRVEVG